MKHFITWAGNRWFMTCHNYLHSSSIQNIILCSHFRSDFFLNTVWLYLKKKNHVFFIVISKLFWQSNINILSIFTLDYWSFKLGFFYGLSVIILHNFSVFVMQYVNINVLKLHFFFIIFGYISHNVFGI
jgi:hypothetical protein